MYFYCFSIWFIDDYNNIALGVYEYKPNRLGAIEFSQIPPIFSTLSGINQKYNLFTSVETNVHVGFCRNNIQGLKDFITQGDRKTQILNFLDSSQ